MGVTAFAQFARLLSQDQLEAVGAFYSESKQRYTAPSITTFHNILTALAPETLDNAISQWTGQHRTARAPVAMDGKDLRGASKQTEAMRIEREREIIKDGTRSIEVTYALTSLGPNRADPETLLALVRNHWHIEKPCALRARLHLR